MSIVLIVEDDPWMADCYHTWLRVDGHTVKHAGSVQEAIDCIDDHLPDLIIADLFLPQANALQLLHILRSHADLAHIPVVVCSAALPPELDNLQPYGVYDVLDKTTLTPGLLRETTRGILKYAAI